MFEKSIWDNIDMSYIILECTNKQTIALLLSIFCKIASKSTLWAHITPESNESLQYFNRELKEVPTVVMHQMTTELPELLQKAKL